MEDDSSESEDEGEDEEEGDGGAKTGEGWESMEED